MKHLLFVTAFAVSVFAACSEKIEEETLSRKTAVNLEVSVSRAVTKATALADEDKISSLQVLVFGDGNKLEAYKSVSASSSLKLGVFSGQKIIHAVVNAPSLSKIVDYKDFYTQVSDLKDNNLGNFVMEGRKSVPVGTADISVPIDVRRMVSKVSLVKVENKLSEIHQGLSFVLKNAYLTNVAGDRGYAAEGHNVPAPKVWYHMMEYSADDGIFSLTHDSLNDVTVAFGASYMTEHNFYCYPNPTVDDNCDPGWSDRHTRLVVEVALNGKTYYYPVTLPVLEQNKHYKVSLAVTRPGSTDPDIPYREDSAVVTVTALPWEGVSNVVEVI